MSDVSKRVRSSIKFPYGDLDDAVEIAEGVHSLGGSECSSEQLAAHFPPTLKNSMFKLKVTTAKVFGLIKNRRGLLTLTDYGRRIIDEEEGAYIRVMSFLSVELYKAIFERYEDEYLPPREVLEDEMRDLGVTANQTDKAYQAFMRSADQAGFFPLGSKGKLVRPLTPRKLTKAQGEKGLSPEQLHLPGADDDPSHHLYIKRLLRELPKLGSYWSKESRVKWLQKADYIFEKLYEGEDDIPIMIEADRWTLRDDAKSGNVDLTDDDDDLEDGSTSPDAES